MECTHGAAKATSKAGASQSLPSHCASCSKQAKTSVKPALPACPHIGGVAPIQAKHPQAAPGCFCTPKLPVCGGLPGWWLWRELWVYGQGQGTPCVGSHWLSSVS